MKITQRMKVNNAFNYFQERLCRKNLKYKWFVFVLCRELHSPEDFLIPLSVELYLALRICVVSLGKTELLRLEALPLNLISKFGI